MSAKKEIVRIGLVGFGAMGKVHAFCVRNLPFFYPDLPLRAEITGLLTTSPERSRTLCQTYQLGKAYETADEMLNDPTIDVIDICTPNNTHYDLLKKALTNGKAVYCEKPLCTTASEAYEIAGLAKEKQIVSRVVFNNRFLSPMQRAKSLIEEGRLGRILSFHADYLHNSALNIDRNVGWKQNKDVCGGGVLFDLGSHILDLIVMLCGSIRTVSGQSQIAYPIRTGPDGKPWRTNADEAFYLTAETESGAHGTITASKLATGTNDDLHIELYGEKGALRFSLMEPNWLYFYDTASPDTPIGGLRGFTRIECVGRYPAPGGAFPSPKAPRGWLSGHMASMAAFLTDVANGQTDGHPDLADAAHIQAVMEAAYLSDAQEGKRVRIDEIH